MFNLWKGWNFIYHWSEGKSEKLRDFLTSLLFYFRTSKKNKKKYTADEAISCCNNTCNPAYVKEWARKRCDLGILSCKRSRLQCHFLSIVQEAQCNKLFFGWLYFILGCIQFFVGFFWWKFCCYGTCSIYCIVQVTQMKYVRNIFTHICGNTWCCLLWEVTSWYL